MTDSNEQDRLRDQVRSVYGRIAAQGGGCCAGGCGETPVAIDGERLGYSSAELALAPEGANLGLGCGNPQAIAALKAGEQVLDLGSGAGFDCFLAARAVGAEGRVIGVDMTAEMINKARGNARQGGFANVEFRLGEIEALPVADGAIDVIISNCVINLSPDKRRVFTEAFRVLKPGGRLAVSDVVATAPIPDEARRDLALYSGCMAGASHLDELAALLAEAGFTDVAIEPKDASREFIRDWAPGRGVEEYVVSASIRAVKPGKPQPARKADGPPLHSSIVSMVSLAAGIAAKHPAMGLCQLARLREMKVPEHQIDSVVEIARHIRDEAAAQLDAAFDDKAAAEAAPSAAPPVLKPAKPRVEKGKPLSIPVVEGGGCGCSTTAGGQSCC